MVLLTPMTILVQFIPAIIVTLGYVILLGRRRNRFIEAFIVLMYLQAVTFFLFNIFRHPLSFGGTWDTHVEPSGLVDVLFSSFLFQFTYALQDFFTWIMVSFIAVFFGMAVLALKLALQDPLKMKFSNVIKRIVGKEPVSDGYSGFRDRVDNITFEGVEPQPLDPEVVKKAWSESWKDYLIIGLATILPSIGIYMSEGDPYVIPILIMLLWMYRFGYPASNRIAKGAGLKLGDRDLGGEMMGGVLGWFFRLNLLLSLFTIFMDVIERITLGTLGGLINYYILGIALAAPPIVFAILLLPLAEDFSVVLYKNVFEGLYRTKDRIIESRPVGFLKNIAAASAIALPVIGAFAGAVFGVCLNFAFKHGLGFEFTPDNVDSSVLSLIGWSGNNIDLQPSIMWILMMLMIPIGMMLLLGILAHYVRRYVGGRTASFAFFSAFFVSFAIWILIPGMDYILGGMIVPVEFGGLLFHRLAPVIIMPTEGQYLFRLAYQFIIAVPFIFSGVLFILYYFQFRESWKRSQGEEFGPMLSVHARDIKDAVLLFVGGIVASVIGVFLLFNFMDIGGVMISVINEIGLPNGLELVYEANVSRFMLYVEHNIIRTLLMLVAGPIFWAIVLWLVGVQAKDTGDRKIGYVSLLLALIAGVASYIWTFLDWESGNYMVAHLVGGSTIFSAELGARAAILYGILFGAYFLIILLNYFGDGKLGGWWLPPLMTLFAIEYFVYDDQFTLIALIILPMILAMVYKVVFMNKPEVSQEDPLITYIRFSLMSLAIAEVLSTALWVAGIGTLAYLGGELHIYLAHILPHAIIEIPAFLFAAAASLRIARDLAPTIVAEDWGSVPTKTKELLTDARLWRTFLLVMFFLAIAALIEGEISNIIGYYVANPHLIQP